MSAGCPQGGVWPEEAGCGLNLRRCSLARRGFGVPSWAEPLPLQDYMDPMNEFSASQ